MQNGSGNVLWQFWFDGGDSFYEMSGVNETGIEWTDAGLEISFTLVSETNFYVVVTPYGRAPVSFSGSLYANADTAISSFQAWNNSAGAGTDHNFYFDDLKITHLVNAQPIINAEVALEETEFRATTDENGFFSITNVPPGIKYTLVAAGPGAAALWMTGITVVDTAVNLGELMLSALTGPYRLVPVTPNVNPAISEVETDGVLFRYYQVLTQDGNLPAPLATFIVKRDDGTVIPQLNVAETAVGYISGTADLFGILRVRVPGDYLTVGSARNFSIYEGAEERMTFSAKARPIEYSNIWKIKAGAGLQGALLGGKGDIGAGGETVIKDVYRDGEGCIGQQITSSLSGDLKVGLSASAGLEGAAYYEAGTGVKIAGKLGRTYHFNPNSEDAYEDALKFYSAMAPFLKLGVLGGSSVIGASGAVAPFLVYYEMELEPAMMSDHIVSAQGEVGVGGYGKFQANIGLGIDGPCGLTFPEAEAKLKAERMLAGKLKRTVWPPESVGDEFSLGLKTSASAKLLVDIFKVPVGAPESIIAFFDPLSFGGEYGFSEGMDGCLFYDIYNGLYLKKVGLKTFVEFYGGVSLPIPGFPQNLDIQSVSSVRDQYIYDLRGKNAPAFWSDLVDGRIPIDEELPLKTVYGLVDTFLSDWVESEKSLYSGIRTSSDIDLGGSIGVAGLGLSVEGEINYGAERVVERSRILRGMRMPYELYDGDLRHFSTDMEDVFEKIGGFAAGAGGILAQALQESVTSIQEGVETTVENAYGAVVFAYGTIAGGANVVSCILAEGASSGQLRRSTRAEGEDYLPPAGVSNYIYGIGGIVSFSSSNELTGTSTLRLSYTDEQLGNLDETALRIYRYSNDEGTWNLLGGEVDTTSNVVTCSISELGIFALAPPMPKYPLSWSLSTNALEADGSSVITVQVRNITMNFGDTTTNNWLFTALDNGVTVLNEDLDTNMPGVQVVSSNASLDIVARAPNGGTEASLVLCCHAGDAAASIPIPLVDSVPPEAPEGVSLSAGQSRIFVSWASNESPDAAYCNIYYRKGEAGPPYDGVAAVEGQDSPAVFDVTLTNVILHGLDINENYYLAISVVDGSGNESELVSAGSVTTSEQPPTAPTEVSVTFGENGTNLLMWALSEDDGFNDRDVIRYDVYRAIMPGGDYRKIAETDAGTGLFVEENIQVESNQFVRYMVKSVDANALESSTSYSSRMIPDAGGVDNDGDAMADDWETLYALDPDNPLDGVLDNDSDGLENSREYELGTKPDSTDSDGDIMTDAWEVEKGLNPAAASSDNGGTGDPDEDGIDNLSEYIADTDPNDAASQFVIENAGMTATNQILVSFFTSSRRIYDVITTTNLNAPWIQCYLPFTGLNSDTELVITNECLDSVFYRINVSLP